MAFESITGSAVATGFLNNYGKYTGSDGIIAKYITNAGIPLTPVILVLIIGCIFLVILKAKHAKQEAWKEIGMPVGLILILMNFLFSGAGSIIALYLAVFVMTSFLFIKTKSLSSGGFIGLLAVIIGLSYLLFGNVLVVPIFGAIGAVAYVIISKTMRSEKRGSRDERRLIREEGFNDKKEDTALNNEEHAEKIAEHDGESGKATAEGSRVEAANISEEIHQEAIGAGIKRISEQMTLMDNAELKAEERDIKVMEMARTVDSQIREHSIENADDAKKLADLKEDMQRIVMIVGAISDDQKYADKYRGKSLDVIEETTEIMKTAANNAEAILKVEINDDRQLRKRLNDEIKKAKKRLETKAKQLEKIVKENKQNSGPVLQEISQLRDAITKATDLRTQANNVLEKGRRVLKLMKTEAKQIVHHVEHIKKFAENMEKLEKHIGRNIVKIQKEFKEFQHEMAGLNKELLPEEAIVKAKNNVKIIFATVKKFTNETIELNKKDLEPFVSESQKLLKEAWQIETAADFGNKLSRKVALAMFNIHQILKLTCAGNSQEAKNFENITKIDKMQADISNYMDWKSNKIRSDMKKSYGDLSNAEHSLETQIRYLQREQDYIERTEKITIDSLDISMTILVKLRKKQFQQIQDYASKAKGQLANAKRYEKGEKAEVA